MVQVQNFSSLRKLTAGSPVHIFSSHLYRRSFANHLKLILCFYFLFLLTHFSILSLLVVAPSLLAYYWSEEATNDSTTTDDDDDIIMGSQVSLKTPRKPPSPKRGKQLVIIISQTWPSYTMLSFVDCCKTFLSLYLWTCKYSRSIDSAKTVKSMLKMVIFASYKLQD